MYYDVNNQMNNKPLKGMERGIYTITMAGHIRMTYVDPVSLDFAAALAVLITKASQSRQNCKSELYLVGFVPILAPSQSAIFLYSHFYSFSMSYLWTSTLASGMSLGGSLRIKRLLSVVEVTAAGYGFYCCQVSYKSKAGLRYKATSHAVESSINSSEMLENQKNVESILEKGYHAVPPPFTRNYMPSKRDLWLIDEHFKSVSMDFIFNIAPSDVKTIDVNHKGVFSIKEPKPVMKNNFSPPIIED
uniref:Uncharacterized protein n=1 Tax=Tanacetum cinerariifolium TaxID=118510 RepID=A0A6L2LJY2_TANCI|nr:hypothetical protein [Tanacetum cinerariifolium]